MSRNSKNVIKDTTIEILKSQSWHYVNNKKIQLAPSLNNGLHYYQS